MQSNKDNLSLEILLGFQYPELFTKAMTFKQFHQEYTARNKDNPLKYGINENFIELGQDLIEFYYNDFFTYQDLPNKTHKIFKTYSDIRKQKQLVLSEKNLADTAVQLGLKTQMLISINPNSELKNNQKILAQALKAIIGAQYFDKKKDLNILRDLLQVVFQEIIKKSLDEAMGFPQQENIKGDFKEFIDKHPELSYKLSYQELKNNIELNQTIYEYELKINDILPIKRSGKQKKAVEKEVFKVALELVKSDKFQQILDDSMRSQLDQSFDGPSHQIQDSIVIESQVSSKFHQQFSFVQQFSLMDQSFQEQLQINEQDEDKKQIERSLKY
ncbi:unnamed protein product [Paramecium primaurelia]|uniref:RNase III domain-containing protein n=1 Tax=Paramecium primaurelia TaxID=5886 RepID=A0A8S1P4J4_PARPR|nr:unnamed protein product [Paramecium primaurelia]